MLVCCLVARVLVLSGLLAIVSRVNISLNTILLLPILAVNGLSSCIYSTLALFLATVPAASFHTVFLIS